MIGFIDEHRAAYGVEPICKVLPIAPSTYHEHVAQRQDVARLSARARQDVALKPEIARVFSPFATADATLALNAGLGFRRGRLLILPPARGQHGRCQIGNPFIPAVQISRTTSQ